MSTKIEWCTNSDGTHGETINPVAGCTKVSSGCANCYALRMARRLRGQGMRGYADVISPSGGWSGTTSFIKSELEKPEHWKKPRMIFVCSMGDLFHEHVPRVVHTDVFEMIDANRRHTFLLLTKRPKRMLLAFGGKCVPENCWIGVTAEHQDAYDLRVPILMQIAARTHFVSVEPMLGPIVMDDLHRKPEWVICGAETGPGKRPMMQHWADELYSQCSCTSIPFFGKKNNEGEPLKVKGYALQQFPKGAK